MNKKLLSIILLTSVSPLICAQVGINTSAPSAMTDIVSKGNTASTKALEVNNSSAIEMLTVLDNGNTGFNVPAPAAKVDILTATASTGFRLRDGNQATGKVLVSDGSGFATWQTPAAGGVTAVTGTLPITTSVSGSTTTVGLNRNNLTNTAGNASAIAPITITNGANAVVNGADTSIAINNDAALWNANKLQGTAVNTTAPSAGQVLSFIGGNWAPAAIPADVTDWKIIGNPASINSSSEALGAAYTTGDVLGTLDALDNLVIVSNGKIRARIDSDGTLQGGSANSASPFASLTWGNNNIISNTLSSNIALGRNNTVGAQGSNFPGAAIGNGNTLVDGAKALGNRNIMSGSAGIAIGNSNGQTFVSSNPTTAGTGIALGVNNDMQGGYAFGISNIVPTNGFGIGSSNKTTGADAMAIGFSGTAGDLQNVYANASHIFYGKSNAATAKVGINVVPTTAADLEVKVAIKINPDVTTSAALPCNSANEGAIRYNGVSHKHEGCGYNGAATVLSWSSLY